VIRRETPRPASERETEIGRVPEGGGMLGAMITESLRGAVVCGGRSVPHRSGIAQWRSAVATAGGLPVADPAIRAARQRCRRWAWSGASDDGLAFASDVELATVIRRLSGRLV
jgi:hypothetical protein